MELDRALEAKGGAGGEVARRAAEPGGGLDLPALGGIEDAGAIQPAVVATRARPRPEKLLESSFLARNGHVGPYFSAPTSVVRGPGRTIHCRHEAGGFLRQAKVIISIFAGWSTAQNVYIYMNANLDTTAHE